MSQIFNIKINADLLAIMAYRVLLLCLSAGLITWVIISGVNFDVLLIIAGFFYGLILTGIISIIPCIMAVTSLIYGTKYKLKAINTTLISIGLFISFLLLYE